MDHAGWRAVELGIYYVLLYLAAVSQANMSPLERQTNPREYCEADTFRPVCGVSEVVVVTEAQYGRQRLGECVKTDFGFVGCSVDVMSLLDNKCSGRRTCEQRMPEPEMDKINTCPEEFRSYLNTSYMCVTVDNAPCQDCHKSGKAKLSAPRAYLASVITEENDQQCGSAKCPWLIEVLPGQKINITLFDFGLSTDGQRFYMPDVCFRYAVIKEKAAQRDTAVCGGVQRQSHVYTSVSNSLEVHIVSPEVFSKKGQFLLYYEAVGCADQTSPPNMYSKREDTKLVVGCQSTGDTWILTCNGTEWQGETGVCPLESEAPVQPGGITLPLGVLIAIVVAIALVIGVLILTVGVVCLKRQQQESRPLTESAVYVRARQDPEYRDDLAAEMYLTAKSHPYHPQSQASKYKANQYRAGFGGQVNLYSHNKMGQRPLPSIPNIPAAAAAAVTPPLAPMARQDSVPPIPTDNSGGSDDDPKMIIAEIHRTNSQASSNNYQSGMSAHEASGPSVSACTTMVAGPRRPRAASARSQSGSYSGAGSAGKDDPQYFVLDPDELTEEQAAVGDRRAARAATAQPEAHGGGATSSSPAQKSPEEEENDENQDKETHLNNSCHEIPLRPSRETPQSSRTEINNTGNTSWP